MIMKCKYCKADDLPAHARRPLNSRLSARTLTEAGFGPMPTVEDALDRYLEEIIH